MEASQTFIENGSASSKANGGVNNKMAGYTIKMNDAPLMANLKKVLNDLEAMGISTGLCVGLSDMEGKDNYVYLNTDEYDNVMKCPDFLNRSFHLNYKLEGHMKRKLVKYSLTNEFLYYDPFNDMLRVVTDGELANENEEWKEELKELFA